MKVRDRKVDNERDAMPKTTLETVTCVWSPMFFKAAAELYSISDSDLCSKSLAIRGVVKAKDRRACEAVGPFLHVYEKPGISSGPENVLHMVGVIEYI